MATGTQQVNEAGRTLDDIVIQAQDVSVLVGEISNATLEQTSGLGQINHAVAQLDQVTQQNATLVEESAAAAESLKRQAELLIQAVGAFKLGSEHREGAVA